MKLLFLSDTYMQDGSFDPFRLELLKSLSLYSSNTLAVITNHYLCNNSCNPRLLCGYSTILDNISEFKPDVVFTLNRAGMTKKLANVLAENCLIITWFIDSYERVPDSLLQFDKNDIVWLTGKSGYEERFRENLGKECKLVLTVPFATNTKVFKPKGQERVIDGCFVGTAFSNNCFIEILTSLCGSEEQRKIFLEVLNLHKKDYISNVKLFLSKAGFLEDIARDRNVWQSIFDDQISLEKRIKYLSALEDFNLLIYGEPIDLWIKSFAAFNSNMLSKYQYKPIKSPEELSNLYNLSKVGINIQHHQASIHSLPIRVFDLMACKTLLMTEQGSTEALNEIGFVENIDFVTFGNPAELKDKFAYYISNDKEREQITDSAYAKVIEYHDLDFRVYQSLKKSLPSSFDLTRNDNTTIQLISNPSRLKLSNKVTAFLKIIKDLNNKLLKCFAL